MADNGAEDKKAPAEGIEQILAERERLERILEERYAKEVAILFSDICGYTRYIDQQGDIAGRSMLLKHNQIVLPLIEKHSGRVVEVIGDAVMAAFADPRAGVLSALAIQEQLHAHNAAVHPKDKIHLKIGIHAGRVLVDEKARRQSLTGDVANLAARIQEHAKKDQILISGAIYERVCTCDEILCRFHDSVSFKGKSDPQKIYCVVWQDEDLVIPKESPLRGQQEEPSTSEGDPQRVFNIEMSRDGEQLLVSAYEGAKGETLTIRDYETLDVSMERIDSRCTKLVDSLNRANQRGRVTREAFFKLRETGQVLYDDLFTLSIKERLKYSKATFLRLNLDESFIHIPWELLHDGRHFLSQRFAMGRSVRTRRSLSGIQERKLARPLRFLIIADPTRDLKSAYEEGTRIRDLMDGHVDVFNVALRTDAIDVESIRKKLRNFDIVHFAGHADQKVGHPQESGWRLMNGFFTTTDIDRMARSAAMPALIFSNSCQSARTDNYLLAPDFQRGIFGLANSFLLSGVKHYIGTFWEVMDEPSCRFALEFYENLSNAQSIGEAVQHARRALIEHYGEDNIVWASYLLYGDPAFNYVHHILPRETEIETGRESIQISGEEARTREEVVDFGQGSAPGRKRRWYTLSAALFVAVLILGGALLISNRKGPEVLEQQAMAAFKSGNYANAKQLCVRLQQQYPGRPLGHLIMGDMLFRQNRLKAAGSRYREVLDGGARASEETAHAMLGLGRIFSVEGKKAEALNWYEKAEKLFPGYKEAHVSKAALLAEQGHYEQSLEALERISRSEGDDPLLASAAKEIRRRWQAETDRQKQERIDQLVDDLIQRMETTAHAQEAEDWSSEPLTVWLMELDTQGPILKEGSEFLLHAGLTEQMLKNERVQVVEREVMDKLMAELRLGSDKLADKQTALTLGRIAAAKVILSGRLIQSGDARQLNIRAIETETGEIFASVSQKMDPSGAPAEFINSLSSELIEKLNRQFPLKGKITGTSKGLAVLDIGRRHGVKKGQSFKVLSASAPAALQIVSVAAENSRAAPTDKSGALSAGMKVELYSTSP